MSWEYDIDVVGTCNLRCPSCPVGNSLDAPRSKGVMSPELFRAIVEKIERETPQADVGLFNWGEPPLNKHLPEFIRLLRSKGMSARISTNLNAVPQLDAIIAAEPTHFRVSLSGFSQASYSTTHVRGQIEKVKENMRAVRDALARHRNATRVEVLYHCYVHNTGQECADMERFAKRLGFRFYPVWAYLMPLEKNLDYLEGRVSELDRSLIDRLAVRPEEQVEIARRHPTPDCSLRKARTTINCDGTVSLCCAVYSAEYHIAESFLDVSHEELQRRKYRHPLCAKCMKHGLHVTVSYGGLEDWHRAAARRIPGGVLPRKFMPKKRGIVRRMTKRIKRSVLSWWS